MDNSRRFTFLLVSLALLTAVLTDGAAAETFTVGGDKGWIVPDSNSDMNYTVWAKNITAHVGDSLYFKYSPTAHNVLKVNATNYAACSTTDFLSTWDTGDTTVVLQENGMHYFICGAPRHCQWGQAFSLDVDSLDSGDSQQNNTDVLTPPGDPFSSAPSAALSLAMVVVVGLVSFGFLLMVGSSES